MHQPGFYDGLLIKLHPEKLNFPTKNPNLNNQHLPRHGTPVYPLVQAFRVGTKALRFGKRIEGLVLVGELVMGPHWLSCPVSDLPRPIWNDIEKIIKISNIEFFEFRYQTPAGVHRRPWWRLGARLGLSGLSQCSWTNLCWNYQILIFQNFDFRVEVPDNIRISELIGDHAWPILNSPDLLSSKSVSRNTVRAPENLTLFCWRCFPAFLVLSACLSQTSRMWTVSTFPGVGSLDILDVG